MTLRTIEDQFTKTLKDQMKHKSSLDLSLDAPLMSVLHPRLIMAKLEFENTPQAQAPGLENNEFSLQCFKCISEAEKAFPEVKRKFVGRPWSFYQFLKSCQTNALVDFGELGAIHLIRGSTFCDKGSELHDFLLPPWTDYALSTELWGPSGKWIRFHERLLALLNKKNLLAGGETLGYYPLNHSAARLETFGFKGTQLDKSYLIVLPWTFSSSDLRKLEEIILQEF